MNYTKAKIQEELAGLNVPANENPPQSITLQLYEYLQLLELALEIWEQAPLTAAEIIR